MTDLSNKDIGIGSEDTDTDKLYDPRIELNLVQPAALADRLDMKKNFLTWFREVPSAQKAENKKHGPVFPFSLLIALGSFFSALRVITNRGQIMQKVEWWPNPILNILHFSRAYDIDSPSYKHTSTILLKPPHHDQVKELVNKAFVQKQARDGSIQSLFVNKGLKVRWGSQPIIGLYGKKDAYPPT